MYNIGLILHLSAEGGALCRGVGKSGRMSESRGVPC